MALQDKYKELIDNAKSAGVQNLQVSEQNNVLHITGEAPDAKTKDNLWNIYNRIDPDFRAGDLVLDVNAKITEGTKAKVVTEKSNLNIRKGPGTDQQIVGKAAHHEIVTVINKTNDQWSFIRTDSGAEGYVYSQYLEQA
ncbi:SH3 domain-containing protein [Niastella populi]|uniref:Peptide-binding protein n=1 Tax=Niastella populi TaxID=550983 RepID=A0A1V9FZ59_9BACT|nr:SH3 domain-containing protein [Niastella populi]OQP63655.1 peptide-binding protein [Niastella populi]